MTIKRSKTKTYFGILAEKTSKILVIDDHQEVLEGVMQILNYGGYEAEGRTRYSDEITEKLKSEKISLLILDVMLSGKDGRDIAQKLKGDEKTRDIPILMISAYPDMESSVKRAGAEYFIKKPFGVQEMISKLEGIFKN